MKTNTATLKFRYSAIDASGAKVSGTETAASSGAAHLALVQRGFQPLEVNEKKSITKFEITKKKVPRKEIMHFSRQMGVFMKAGIPIMEALEVIETETTDKLMKKVILEMIDDLRAGDTFTAAAASHPEAFPNFYVGILESAELTGNLDTVLNQLADYIERDVEARSTLTSALIYPAVVAFMSVGVVVVLATFVMPRFVVFFNSLHAKLPLPTRMLLAGSSFFSHHCPRNRRARRGHSGWFRLHAAFNERPGDPRRDHSEVARSRPPRPGGCPRAHLPGAVLHDQGRCRPSPGDVRDGGFGEQCRLQERHQPDS